MDKPFFIMMYSQNGKTAMPILDGSDEDVTDQVAFYATEAEARKVAEEHAFAPNFGYEIFEMGTGE